MKSMNLQVVIFCAIIWLINQVEAQNVKCDYNYHDFWTDSYRSKDATFYSCYLNIGNSNYNEKLTRIDVQHGTGYTDAHVKYISNHVDKLKTFSSIFCQKFPNIELFQIANAELESIDEDSLSNCKNLNRLLLDGNKIREIPGNLLIRNLKLTYLWIYNNQLTTLPENLFLNQKELVELYLQQNQINFLPNHIFRPLVKLEVLNLDNNRLQAINPGWFVNLQNLKQLVMAENQISEIPLKCFASLRNLEKLWINNNKLTIIHSSIDRNLSE